MGRIDVKESSFNGAPQTFGSVSCLKLHPLDPPLLCIVPLQNNINVLLLPRT